MNKKHWLSTVVMVTVFSLGILVGTAIDRSNMASAQSTDRVFELRTYTTLPGRLDALHSRFRDHTMRIFEKHGMTNIGYFSPQDEPLAENTLIYIIAHDSREAAAANWEAFIADPEWQRVSEESQRDGRIIEKLESVFMDPTDYSQLR
jgi:hypothetical protein